MFKLEDMDFEGKRVIIREDHNVPLDDNGDVVNDKRLIGSLPTIKYVLEHGGKIILITHMGRPKGEVIENLKTDKMTARLSELLGKEIKKVDDCVGDAVKDAVMAMQTGDIIYLENSRFHNEEKEKNEEIKEEFGKQIAEFGEVYINDAFSNSHRDHASMTTIPRQIPGCAGLLLQKELDMLSKATKDLVHPFVAIVGGAKPDKIDSVRNLLKKADFVIISGILANTFLTAIGHDLKKSKYDADSIDAAKALFNEFGAKIVLPVDLIAADKWENDAHTGICSVENFADGTIAMDIGPETVKKYKGVLKDAKTIVWAGPPGVFEMSSFVNGTKEIAEFIATLDAVTIIGGGDTAAAIEKLGLSDKMTHVSTGGGASLMFLEGKELPAVKALEESAEKFSS